MDSLTTIVLNHGVESVLDLHPSAAEEALSAAVAESNSGPECVLPSMLDHNRIGDVYNFVARLHLIPNREEMVATALEGLNRLMPAAEWTIYSAQTSPHTFAMHLEVLDAYPLPPSVENTAHADEVDDPHARESTPLPSEKIAATESASEAAATGKLVRRDAPGHSTIAVALVYDARVLGVLVGRRDEAGGAWTEADERLLESLVVPFAAWLAHRRQSAEAERLLLTDDLTKLRNARFLRETLIGEIKRARRYGTQLSVLFIDLDNFKTVNDEHGHLVGSHALIEAAGAILGGVRNTDTVARYGGDEFVVVLPDTPLEGAEQVAERIRHHIETQSFTGGRRLTLRITASLGIAAFPSHAQSPQQLIAAADAAMYSAKGAQKNCVHTADFSRVKVEAK